MTKHFILISAALFLTACHADRPAAAAGIVVAEAVPNDPPNAAPNDPPNAAGQKPAFAGQTRAPAESESRRPGRLLDVAVYVVTDEDLGRLLKITPAQ